MNQIKKDTMWGKGNHLNSAGRRKTKNPLSIANSLICLILSRNIAWDYIKMNYIIIYNESLIQQNMQELSTFHYV